MKRLLFPNLLKSEIEKGVSSLVQIKPVGSFILFYSHDGFSALELGHNSNCFPPIGALEIIRKVDFIRIYIKVIKGHSSSINQIFYSSIVVPHHVLIPKPKRHIFPQSYHLYPLFAKLHQVLWKWTWTRWVISLSTSKMGDPIGGQNFRWEFGKI